MVTFGILADIQYCDAPVYQNRHYRQSISKLKHAIEVINRHPLDFVINLGDTIDRDRESFGTVLPLLGQSRAPVFHVLGNHDYAVATEQLAAVPGILGTECYYDFAVPPWRFVVLDGNEISTFSTPPGSRRHRQAQALLSDPGFTQRVNARPWNGGISETQLGWLEQRLSEAGQRGEPVVVFCHYPVFPLDWHTLFNADQLIALLDRHVCVKAWINGHNHHGNYGCRDGLHFVTLHGMVETERDSAFAVATLADNVLDITGFGREPDRRLVLR